MLHLHPLSYRREITRLLYVFKCIKGYYDVAWHNNIEVISKSSLRSGSAGRVPRMKMVKTECFKRSFFNRIVPMWNALPRHLRDADTIYSFKRKLVMHYDNLITDFDTDNVWTWSGALGVTPVCVIVVLHVKTLFLLIVLLFNIISIL